MDQQGRCGSKVSGGADQGQRQEVILSDAETKPLKLIFIIMTA